MFYILFLSTKKIYSQLGPASRKEGKPAGAPEEPRGGQRRLEEPRGGQSRPRVGPGEPRAAQRSPEEFRVAPKQSQSSPEGPRGAQRNQAALKMCVFNIVILQFNIYIYIYIPSSGPAPKKRGSQSEVKIGDS